MHARDAISHFSFLISHLKVVPLRRGLESTFIRKNKKNANFFGFLLIYSYLCTRSVEWETRKSLSFLF